MSCLQINGVTVVEFFLKSLEAGVPIYSTFQLQIKSSNSSENIRTDRLAGQEKLENSNSILILF